MRINKNASMGALMLAVFCHYLTLALPLAGIALQVINEWGMSEFWAGSAASGAYLGSIVFRKTVGSLCDRVGGSKCYKVGLAVYFLGALVSLTSLVVILPVPTRFAFLLAGRFILGAAEAASNVGNVVWAVDIFGAHRSGRAFANVGMALYGSTSVASILGYWLYTGWGFGALLGVSTLCPLISLAIAHFLQKNGAGSNFTRRSTTKPKKSSIPTGKILLYILPKGLPTICNSVGFIVLGTFLGKTFVERGWPHPGAGFAMYGIGFVLSRIFFGNAPDKYGGTPVCTVSAALQTVGLFVIWLAPSHYIALLGSLLTGAGCSLIFPSMGVDIMREIPAGIRGAGLSFYNMFIDLGYTLGAPAAGSVADRWGSDNAYLFAALCCLGGTVLFLRMLALRRIRPPAGLHEPKQISESYELAEQLDAAGAALIQEEH